MRNIWYAFRLWVSRVEEPFLLLLYVFVIPGILRSACDREIWTLLSVHRKDKVLNSLSVSAFRTSPQKKTSIWTVHLYLRRCSKYMRRMRRQKLTSKSAPQNGIPWLWKSLYWVNSIFSLRSIIVFLFSHYFKMWSCDFGGGGKSSI